MKSSCQLTCVHVYWTTAMQTSGVTGSKSLTLLIGPQNNMFGQHTGEVWALSYTW